MTSARTSLAYAIAGLLLLILAFDPAAGEAAGFSRSYGSLLGGPADTSIDAVASDAAGNVYLAGRFSVNVLDLGTVTLPRIGWQDAFIAKLDAAGNTLWAKNFGGNATTTDASGLAVDTAGNVVVGGTFAGTLATPPLTALGLADGFVARLDALGNLIWAKRFGGNAATVAVRGVATDGTGHVYVGGEFSGASLTTPALTRVGIEDAFVLKLDVAGNTVWARSFSGAGATAQVAGIAVDGSANVLLGGSFATANLATPLLFRIGDTDTFTIKLDPAGSTLWARNFGGIWTNRAKAGGIAVDPAGNVYVTGTYDLAMTTPVLTRIGYADTYVIRMDGAGQLVWAKTFGGAEAQAEAHGIAADAAGNAYVTGGYYWGRGLSMPALPAIGTWNAFAFKVDAGGAAPWARAVGGASAVAHGNGIAVDSAGDVLLGGSFALGNLTQPELIKVGNSDAFVIKYAVGNRPYATTGAATTIPPLTATFSGFVTDYGVDVTGTYFEYGTSLDYGAQVGAAPSRVGPGVGNTPISATVSGLGCNTLYHYRAGAAYAAGTVAGDDGTFATQACSGGPMVTTGTPTVSQTSAVLRGTVTDVGSNVIVIAFDYGATAAYGSTAMASITAIVARPGLPTTVAPTAPVSGLACGTTYHFRVLATDMSATNHGADRVFSTLGCTEQSIAFGAPPSLAAGDSGPLSATSTSGLTVSLASMTPAVCSTSGNTVSAIHAGTCTIAADQDGDATYNAAPQATLSFPIAAGPSSVVLVGAPNPSARRGVVTFTATVSGHLPAGTVSFVAGAIPLCGAVPVVAGQAQCRTTRLAAGGHTVTATYSGDTNNQGSGSPAIVQTVDAATTADVWWDVLWHRVDGTNRTWQYTGAGASQYLSQNPQSSTFDWWPGATWDWHPKFAADIDGDGVRDVLWFLPQYGRIAIWLMASPSVLKGIAYPASVGWNSPWTLAGAGDIDGDGRAELVWRNSTTGQVLAWTMTPAGSIAGTADLGTVPLSYSLLGIGDVNGDGIDDVLWFQSTNGQVALWLMTASRTHTTVFPGAVGASSWRPYRIADLDGDGKGDIFWRHEQSGLTAVWYMNGGTREGYDFFISAPIAEWQLGMASDFDGDGRCDLMWYGPGHGSVVRWRMQGRHITPIYETVGNVGFTWEMAQ